MVFNPKCFVHQECEEERLRLLQSPSNRRKLAMRGVRLDATDNTDIVQCSECSQSDSDVKCERCEALSASSAGNTRPRGDIEGKYEGGGEGEEWELSADSHGLYRDVCSSIHTVIQVQMKSVRQKIHDQAMSLWSYTRTGKRRTNLYRYIDTMHQYSYISIKVAREHADSKDELLLCLNNCVQRLWPTSFVEIYGSYVTKLSSLGPSDLDLVVCFGAQV